MTAHPVTWRDIASLRSLPPERKEERVVELALFNDAGRCVWCRHRFALADDIVMQRATHWRWAP